jgi:hypothetical protein
MGGLDNACQWPDDGQRKATITHPFSPDKGRSFVVVRKTRANGRDRVVCVDEAGGSRSFLLSWTDYPACDPYEALLEEAGAKNGGFRFECLDGLAALLSGIERM